MYLDYDAASHAQRALDWFAIDNVFSAHCYCLRAQKRRHELDHYWAARKDLAYSEGTSCYNGRKSVYRVYAELEEEMQREKLKLLHEKFPEVVPLEDAFLGVGDLSLEFSGSPYIEVAKDGKTAKGIWYVKGLDCEPDENGDPNAVFHSGRVAAEFVKEDGEWKIWHYRTSPDFSYQIPRDAFLRGTANYDNLHPNPDCPKPNLKLRPLGESGLYSAARVPGFAPELPQPYESWDLASSFVCPEDPSEWQWTQAVGAEPPLDNTEGDARYAVNYVEVLNVADTHGYGYNAQQFVQELDRFWAQRTENLAGCHADRAHQGHDIQYKYYARGNIGMNWGKVKIMNGLFPDRVELDPRNMGIGELVIRFDTSPYVVVAEDGKTAQAVWYTFGLSTEINKQAYPVPFMQWGREVGDFILEGDTWRYLHFRLNADIDYLLDGGIVLSQGLENGRPRTVKLDKPAPDSKLRPFLMDEVYSPFRVTNWSPEPPNQFETWDNRSSWVLPEETG